MKIVGIVPARMAASRFPGKPLFSILGRPMVEHVFCRARLYQGWDELVLATCDAEIEQFANAKGYPLVMTGSHHTRALDRVAEAATKLATPLGDNDIVVCVQGDEPMMLPDMIDAVVAPLKRDPAIPCTVLAMHITEEGIWRNPDTVKLIYNAHGEVLYTSRAAVPYCKGAFTPALEARRIYGIFAFRWQYLQAFTLHPETRLEQLEACDSNRILDMPFRQYIAPYPFVKSYSVDSPTDIALVESHMQADACWGKY
ncbi:MAG: 3-deoxy-manno-octulosonate cytidylyltransferase [Sulfuritalea sp.]|nr:3-deoxy-manno-octulosonate cytidylyltransferase [Sulfuritalea sp.]